MSHNDLKSPKEWLYPEPPFRASEFKMLGDLLTEFNTFSSLVNEKLDKLEELFSRVELLESKVNKLNTKTSTTEKSKVEEEKPDKLLMSSINEQVLSQMAETIAASTHYRYIGLHFGNYGVYLTEDAIKQSIGKNATPVEVWKATLDRLVQAGVTKKDFVNLVDEKLKLKLFINKFAKYLVT